MQFSKYFVWARKEFKNAEDKHPVFCRTMCSHTKPWYDINLPRCRRVNDNDERRGVHTAERILNEEVMEVFEACSRNDAEGAIVELVQVIAVCFRCIAHILTKGCQ